MKILMNSKKHEKYNFFEPNRGRVQGCLAVI
jgi:hypothetical protein